MNFAIENGNRCDMFTTVFQTVKSLTDHISIEFKTDGIHMQVMDNSKVSIVELYLPVAWFDKYECEQNVVLGLNANIMYKILNTREKMQKIEFVYETKKTDTLSIHFTGENKDEYDKFFQMPLIDLEMEQMCIPDIEYVAEFSVASNIFANLINQLKLFGETMDIFCSEEKIMLTANSQDSGQMAVEMKIDDLDSFAIDEGETLKISFSLNYMQQICSCNKIAKEVEIKLSENYPLSVIYDLGEEASMKFYLAPKMNDTDE